MKECSDTPSLPMTTFSQQSQTRQVTPPRAVLHEDAATGLLDYSPPSTIYIRILP